MFLYNLNRHAHAPPEAHLVFVCCRHSWLPPLLLLPFCLKESESFTGSEFVVLSWLVRIEHAVDLFGPVLVLADNVKYSVFFSDNFIDFLFL